MPQVETEKKDNPEKVPPKKKWKIILGFFLLLLIIAVILIWLKLRQPISGEIITTNLTPAEMEKAIPAFERFEGKYLSFRHSADYAVKSQEDAPAENGVIWETAFLATGEINSTKIALTVENLENRKITDATSYNMRKMNPEKYREEKFSAGEIKGTAFTASQAEIYEKVVFVERDNFLVAIALTGPNGSDEEKNQELEDIVQSIQWKK